MRSAAAAVLALGVLTIPATAFNPEDINAPGARVGAASVPTKSVKVQDRIALNKPLIFAFAPEMAGPSTEAVKRDYAWDAALDARIAAHAAMNGVPIELARRVVRRESNGNARAVSKGNYGLMQIRLGTAQAMGYRGNVQGLLDAETNMTYAMKYLSGALRAAGGNQDRAVALYARGYFPEARKMGFSPFEPPRAAGLAPVTALR